MNAKKLKSQLADDGLCFWVQGMTFSPMGFAKRRQINVYHDNYFISGDSNEFAYIAWYLTPNEFVIQPEQSVCHLFTINHLPIYLDVKKSVIVCADCRSCIHKTCNSEWSLSQKTIAQRKSIPAESTVIFPWERATWKFAIQFIWVIMAMIVPMNIILDNLTQPKNNELVTKIKKDFRKLMKIYRQK